MRVGPFRMPVPSTVAAPRAAGAERVQAAQAVTKATPAAASKQLDGHLIGGDGKAYPPGTPYTEVPPTRPSNGKPAAGTLIFVNGMGETVDNASQRHRIADKTGMNVVAIYNATEGSVKDLIQAAGDTFNLGTNKAVDSLADQVYARLMAGEPVRLISHSQGGLITSRALTDVRNRMVAEGGLTLAQAEQKLGLVGVETLGSAAPSWPDGPRYVHYVNRSDIVPMALGVGRPKTHPGKDAHVITFGSFNPFGGWFGGQGHSTETYFKHYVPFEEAARS